MSFDRSRADVAFTDTLNGSVGCTVKQAMYSAQSKDCHKPADNMLKPLDLIEQAEVLLSVGKFSAALQKASEACHISPDLAQAHYAYGEAWLALGQPARAEQAFAVAIQRAPVWADAWVNYGITRYRQGSTEDAKIAMRQALLAAPGHPAALANLGAFLRITGNQEEAETLLRATLAQEPKNFGARLNLAADLLQEERAGEALALLEEIAAPSDPRAIHHWHLQLALALLQLGRAAAARASLEALTALGPIPLALAPLWHWRHLLLALCEADEARAQGAAEAMAASLETSCETALPEHRIMAHYDLAKFWSARDARGRAFAHWLAGHKLLQQSQTFSRQEHRALIDANIAIFDRARFARGSRAGNVDPAPVFIVGMPRSGTTLCEQILAAHADVHGAGERSAVARLFDGLGGGTHDPSSVARLASLDAATLERAATNYLAELHALAPDKARIIDKMPGNYLHLGLIGLVLPGARIIYCVRDPRDIGLSIFTFRFHGAHGYAHDLADLGWTIAQQVRLMTHWRAALPNPILTVALADWIFDFDGTLARVLAHLDLRHDTGCARFHENESRVRTVSRVQVRQPVNAKGLGRWRAYAAELAPMIAEFEAAGLDFEDVASLRG